MTPTEKHRETARAAIAETHAVFKTMPAYDDCVEAFARALAKAEREGMKRAAEIAEDIEVQKPGWAEIAPRQFDAGVCCVQTSIAYAILSECGEGA